MERFSRMNLDEKLISIERGLDRLSNTMEELQEDIRGGEASSRSFMIFRMLEHNCEDYAQGFFNNFKKSNDGFYYNKDYTHKKSKIKRGGMMSGIIPTFETNKEIVDNIPTSVDVSTSTDNLSLNENNETLIRIKQKINNLEDISKELEETHINGGFVDASTYAINVLYKCHVPNLFRGGKVSKKKTKKKKRISRKKK